MFATLPRLATVLVLVLICRVGLAQQQPPTPHTLDETGTVKAVGLGKVQMETSKSEMWFIDIKPNTKVLVDGTAETAYLRPGLAVRFSGEFDKKGALQAEIKELAIFTPQGKNALGLFADGDSDKPLRNAPPGTQYDIRGKITSFKENELIVKVGTKTISGKMAEDAAVKVNIEDISVAQAGDTLKVKALYYDQQKANGTNPGEASGEEVSISLAKPLAPKKKGIAKPVKVPKEKKDKKPVAQAGEEGPLVVQDPFGVDAPKDPKKKGRKPKPDETEDGTN